MYHQVIHTSLIKWLSSPSSCLLRMQKLSVPFSQPTLFHKYCPHSGICRFGQKISPDTQRRPEVWITTSNSESSAATRPPRSAKHPESCHYPHTSMVSFADSALRRAASLRKLSWDSQKDMVAWSGTVLGFKPLHMSKRNPQIPPAVRHLHILPVQFLGPVYVTEQSNPDCPQSGGPWP